MIPKIMPRVYRWMLTASSLVFIIYAIEDGRGPIWGVVGQVVMMFAGLSVLWVAWRPSRKVNLIAAYLTTIAVLFEVAALTLSRIAIPWVTASVLWLVFGIYTVALISFTWIRKTSKTS